MSACLPASGRGRPSAELVSAFSAANKVLILPHHNPDGDALGAVAALAQALSDSGRAVDFLLAGSYPDHLAFIVPKCLNQVNLDNLGRYDLIVIVDCHSFDRLGPDGPAFTEYYQSLPSKTSLAVIDHHLLTPGSKPDALWYHDVLASSTGELVYELLAATGWSVTRPAAEAILLSLISDTGHFTQGNTTPDCLTQTAELLRLGARIDYLNRHLTQNQPARRLRLLGQVLNSLQLHHDGRVATILLTEEMLAASGAKLSDAGDFINFPRALAGVQLSAMIRITKEGQVKVSMRSCQEVDSAALAAQFGGGGHRQASAYTDQTSDPQVALKTFVTEAIKYLVPTAQIGDN